MRLPLLLTAVAITTVATALSGCHSSSKDNSRAAQAHSQLNYAKQLARDYERCIGRASVPQAGISRQLQREVAESNCDDYAKRYNVVLEQAYTNACLHAGHGDLKTCDAIAVKRAQHDSEQLKQRANDSPIKPSTH